MSAKHRTLLLEATGDDNVEDDGDDEEQGFLPVIVGIVVLLILVSLYRERLRVARTGRHKKVDG
jgi:hypothetical protein